MKRGLDLGGALVGLVLAGPVLLVLVVAVRLTMGHPVFFRQTRVGRAGHRFQILKLRTMTNARDSRGDLLPDERRLTPLGRFLRATSLDELPQLWNLVKGDMSLVGPRPLLPQYLHRYNDHQRRRHEVKPGITGWAQIHGRNRLTWEEKFDLDVWYVDNRSVWLDIKILALTFWKVVCHDGISQTGHATMPEFRATAGQPDREQQ